MPDKDPVRTAAARRTPRLGPRARRPGSTRALGLSLAIVATVLGMPLAATALAPAARRGAGPPAPAAGPRWLPSELVKTSRPALSGTPLVGQSLSVSAGTWSEPPSSYAYQWQVCDATGNHCADIPGATGQTLTLTPADLGATVRALVTAAGAVESAPAASPVSGLIGSRIKSRMTWEFGYNRTVTIVESLLALALPRGVTIEVGCRGGGCPFTETTVTPAGGSAQLKGLFSRRRLAVGTHITVGLIKPGWVGVGFDFTTRAGRAPIHSSGCLAPGSTRVGRGC